MAPVPGPRLVLAAWFRAGAPGPARGRPRAGRALHVPSPAALGLLPVCSGSGAAFCRRRTLLAVWSHKVRNHVRRRLHSVRGAAFPAVVVHGGGLPPTRTHVFPPQPRRCPGPTRGPVLTAVGLQSSRRPASPGHLGSMRMDGRPRPEALSQEVWRGLGCRPPTRSQVLCGHRVGHHTSGTTAPGSPNLSPGSRSVTGTQPGAQSSMAGSTVLVGGQLSPSAWQLRKPPCGFVAILQTLFQMSEFGNFWVFPGRGGGAAPGFPTGVLRAPARVVRGPRVFGVSAVSVRFRVAAGRTWSRRAPVHLRTGVRAADRAAHVWQLG